MKFQTYLILIIVIAFFGLVGMGAYALMMQSRRANELQQAPRVITSPESSLSPASAGSPPSSLQSPTSQLAASSSPATSPALPLTAKPVVIFQVAGAFTDAEKAEIAAKVTNPYILYHQGDVGEGTLLNLTVSRNPNASSKDTYPYAVEGVFDSGVNQGFLVEVTGGPIAQGGKAQWWVPECLIECPFSDEFTQMYPEIVAKTKGE